MPIREENGFAFSAEETLALITPRTRLLILNSPANPTGGVTPRAEIEKLVKGLEAHPHVAILSDEIYDVMTYDGETHCSLLAFPEIRDRLIVLNGWSKTWAMTGWRMGWSIWPNRRQGAHLYDKVRKLAVNCWSCVNAPSQFAGIAAIDGPQDDVDKMMRAFDRRRKIVVEGLNALPGISCITPKGAFYAFPNISKTGWKAKKLASALLEEAGVALIGGPDFGILGEGYIRLSYANSEENILRALERIEAFPEVEVTVRLGLPSPDIRHLGGHHGHEQHVGVERQAGHVDHGVGDAADVHHRFGGDRAVGLRHADGHRRGHLGQRVADVDLAAGDVEGPAVERQRLGQAGDGVLGRRIGNRARARRMRRDRAVVDDAAAHRLLPAHGAKRRPRAQEGAGEIDRHDVVPDLDRDLVDQCRSCSPCRHC